MTVTIYTPEKLLLRAKTLQSRLSKIGIEWTLEECIEDIYVGELDSYTILIDMATKQAAITLINNQ